MAGPVAAAQAESLTLSSSAHPTAGSPVTITASGSADYQFNSLSISYAPPGSSASCGSAPSPPGSVTLLTKALPAGAFSVAGRFTPARAGTYEFKGELTGSSPSSTTTSTNSGSTTTSNSTTSDNNATYVQCLAVKIAPAPHPAPPPPSCHVPKLTGLTLRSARYRLGVGHCKLGKVSHKRYKHPPKGRTVVLSQGVRSGKVLKPGAAVGITLGVTSGHMSNH